MTNDEDRLSADERGGAPLFETLRQSSLARVFGLLALVLTLQVPIRMIRDLIHERETRRQEAIADVTRSWGGAQVVAGPLLVVPYVREIHTETFGPKEAVKQIAEERYILPETLDVEGSLATETRRRGIFDVPLYVARLALSGSFRVPARADFPADATAIRWDQATLVLAIGDPKAIRDEVVLQWQGQRVEGVRPGAGSFDLYKTGLHAVIPIQPEPPAGAPLTFALDLSLAGSDGLSILPAGSQTSVRLRAPWPDPRFDGAYLPIEHRVSAEGFDARWQVRYMARSFPPAWKGGGLTRSALDESLLGVSLLSPVDAYRVTDRAVKYQLLFLGLTFLAILLLELIGGLRVHPIQYLLIGCALCLFYLLLLSLAEQVGFDIAYGIAAAAIVALVAAYGRAVLRSVARTAAIAGGIAALYAYLFVLLQIQDYALLVGSLGLLAILAGVMYLTRKVDWYALPFRSPQPSSNGETMLIDGGTGAR